MRCIYICVSESRERIVGLLTLWITSRFVLLEKFIMKVNKPKLSVKVFPKHT